MGPVQIGVRVDHLRLDPQTELHAERSNVIDDRGEARRPRVGADPPIAETGRVVAATAEPAIVEDEPLDAHVGGDVGELLEGVEPVVEVDGLPGVEDHRSHADGRELLSNVTMERLARRREAGVRPGDDHVGGAIGVPARQLDLGRFEQLADLHVTTTVRQPLGGDLVVAAPGELDAPHLTGPFAEATGSGEHRREVVVRCASGAILDQRRAREVRRGTAGIPCTSGR